MKLLFIGDIFAKAGRRVLENHLEKLKSIYKWDVCIANAENAAGGKGINYNTAQEIFKCGVDTITLGNHTWARREVLNFIDSCEKIVRPSNYSRGLPGKGRIIIEKNGVKIGVINLIGRVYMDSFAECPFQTADRDISVLRQQCKVIIVDFHAEATSEKLALAYYLDGRVSAVVGTHTHVQTADEKILENKTAYISDVGMTGPADGVIGVDRNQVIRKFITGLPVYFEPAGGRTCLNAVLIDIDEQTGHARDILRISEIYD
ncbi:metallophosphoesterase [Thermoclostridium stercorarium subsp. stercorarium DSM 8532]|uniref:Metallophosphoesterase n=3 Tax=Thermoclostridium stercorarium TaxID=1510 RepID=L7VNU1_THES1|nr:TIGR00282 family metallophosphoesterase [Thermoclostridium stercorarium]AGC68452.1 metallophosphoesterase [Thermoclostridium stercorarium subsp. stercorarium DSM 8532]AGI39471.1 metallophosphoesterase [Thermoclostridium stercorarium subsp. stercorarium DSM 8532]ANW98819.1 metallophosphoesterase [Thermoclostridium stercorarium subsp. thermolacticum DSM 2910]ANX01343.1 metallophosphoesterase [Thermoclostridium stercorarium subsp. leptospartum DSM 9219]UZQ84448.1 TIGR00282 family metallophosph